MALNPLKCSSLEQLALKGLSCAELRREPCNAASGTCRMNVSVELAATKVNTEARPAMNTALRWHLLDLLLRR